MLSRARLLMRMMHNKRHQIRQPSLDRRRKFLRRLRMNSKGRRNSRRRHKLRRQGHSTTRNTPFTHTISNHNLLRLLKSNLRTNRRSSRRHSRITPSNRSRRHKRYMTNIIRPIQSNGTRSNRRQIRRTILLRSMPPRSKSYSRANSSQHMRRHPRRHIRILKSLIRNRHRHRNSRRNSQRTSRRRSSNSTRHIRRTAVIRRYSMLIRSSRISIRQNTRILKNSINRKRHRQKRRKSRRRCTRRSRRKRHRSPYRGHTATTRGITQTLHLHLSYPRTRKVDFPFQ